MKLEKTVYDIVAKVVLITAFTISDQSHKGKLQ